MRFDTPIPSGFFDDVVSGLKTMCQISSSGTDARFLQCCQKAYASICGECNRDFHTNGSNVIEEFFGPGNEITLTRYSVSEIVSIKTRYVSSDDDVMSTDYYKLVAAKNVVKIAYTDSFGDDVDIDDAWIVIEYKGGVLKIEDIPLLREAVCQMALIIHRKIDYIGVVPGEDNKSAISEVGSADVQLPQSVKDMVKPLKLYGN